MRTHVLAAASALAVAAAVFLAAGPARAADKFGSPGVIISADRVMPLISFTSTKQDDTNGDGGSTTTSNTSIALVTNGLNIFGADLYNLPRLGLDVAVIPHLTVGGSIWVYTQLSSSQTTNPPNNQPSTTTDQPKYTYWGFAPRVGWVFNAGDKLAIWPRVGIEYQNLGASSVTNNNFTQSGGSFWQLAADLEAMLVITPWNHFGITVGPTADIPFAGKQSTTTSATNNGTTTTTTSSTDVRVLQIGASLGLLGYF